MYLLTIRLELSRHVWKIYNIQANIKKDIKKHETREEALKNWKCHYEWKSDLDIKIEIEKNQNWVNGPISFASCIRDKNELNKQRKR